MPSGVYERRPRRPMSPSLRFWVKVTKTPTCWLWTGCTNNKGYGQFNINRIMVLAHRVAWELTNGSIPKGLCVLHNCDNPLCINPAHLFLGTQEDNAMDRDNKGRARGGDTTGYFKLTEIDILVIEDGIRNGESVKNLAEYFSVTPRTIYHSADVKGTKQDTRR